MTEAQDLAAVIDGARLANSLPYISAELDKAMAVVVTRVENDYNNGRLTPELAMATWVELISYRRLLRRFQQKVQVGIASGQRQAAVLDNLPLPR